MIDSLLSTVHTPCTYICTSTQKANPPKQNIMLPPIPPSTLRENPQFAQLYRHLTTNILAPDGSIKPSPQEAQERKQVAEVLMSSPITTNFFKNFPLPKHLLISIERLSGTRLHPNNPRSNPATTTITPLRSYQSPPRNPRLHTSHFHPAAPSPSTTAAILHSPPSRILASRRALDQPIHPPIHYPQAPFRPSGGSTDQFIIGG